MRTHSQWLGFLLLTFIITLPISWVGLSKVNFFYSSLYDSIGIEQHIQRFAPKNRFERLEFEKVPKEEVVELFNGVVVAINNHGEGLDSLQYVKESTQKKIKLFTEAEVIHLQDVANLLDNLKPIVLVLIVLWFIAVFWILSKRIKIPSAMQFFFYTLILLALVMLVLAFGPVKVFNQLHIWIFPSNHQWFFYYEDSLMSTMMKAPILFGYIAAIWGAFSILLSALLLKLLHLRQNSSRLK